MSEILTESSAGIVRIQLNRPAKKNAMTSGMYATLAELLTNALQDDATRVVILYGAGDSFTAGNDLQDFLKNPLKPGESAQERLVAALIAFDKPLIAAVHGAAVGSGTTMLTHFDFVYAAQNARFQMPFVNLAVVPELGTSYSIPAAIGYIRAAELFLLAAPFDAKRAADLGLITRVVADDGVLEAALETARALVDKPLGSLRASKRLLKRVSAAQVEAAAAVETQEFVARLQSAEAREAITAFLEKRRPDFSKLKSGSAAGSQ